MSKLLPSTLDDLSPLFLKALFIATTELDGSAMLSPSAKIGVAWRELWSGSESLGVTSYLSWSRALSVSKLLESVLYRHGKT